MKKELLGKNEVVQLGAEPWLLPAHGESTDTTPLPKAAAAAFPFALPWDKMRQKSLHLTAGARALVF